MGVRETTREGPLRLARCRAWRNERETAGRTHAELLLTDSMMGETDVNGKSAFEKVKQAVSGEGTKMER